MIKVVSINKSFIQNEKWTPKSAYIFKKLELSPKAVQFEKFIVDGPINGIDLRTFKEKGKSYIRVSDMKRFFISYTSVKQVELENLPKKIILQENDILISRKGTPGISAITSKQDLNNVIGTEAILVRINKNYDPYYLVAFLNSKFFFEQVVNNLSGTVAPGINHSSLKKLKILYDDNLVKSISKKVKEAIDLQTKSSELIIKAQNSFYQKINIDFAKIKQRRTYSARLSSFAKADLWTPAFSYPLYINTLKAIQKKWQTVLLGEIATVKKGDEVGSVNYNKYLDKKNNDIPFIRTSDLVNHEADTFPDFYIPEDIYQELRQDVKAGDVLFTKDGKIGISAMVTKNDKAIIASGVVRLRLKTEAKKYNFTSEYLFIVLSLKETGLYPAIRRTVTASTIPHLREERLKEFEIPILDKNSIDEITKLTKEAFGLKDEKKKLIKEVREEIDDYSW